MEYVLYIRVYFFFACLGAERGFHSDQWSKHVIRFQVPDWMVWIG